MQKINDTLDSMQHTKIKLLFFTLLSLFTFGATNAFAITKCVGEPVTLNWSSSNVVANGCTLTPSTNNPVYCAYNPAADVPGSRAISLPSGSCTNTITCGAATAVSTLTINSSQFWNGSACVAPAVVGTPEVTCQYYCPAADLDFTCTNADSYVLTYRGAPVSSGAYTGPVHLAGVLTGGGASGEYAIKCTENPGGGLPVVESTSVPLPAILGPGNLPAVPNVMSIVASPRTISKGQKTTLTWKAEFPSSSCSLTANSVCVSGQCTALQNAAAAALTTKINTETTDTNDPGTIRSILTAIRNVLPGHKDNDVPRVSVDWMGGGKKTFLIDTTTDFVYTCGTAPTTKTVTARVLVTKSTEQ